MLLGGLWHGASLNFVLWGLLHGIALSVHKLWMGITGIKADVRHSSRLLRAICILVTFHFVCLCWIFFRNTDFANSMAMMQQIATNFHADVAWQWMCGYWQVLVLMAVGYALHFVPASTKTAVRRSAARMPLWAYVLVLVLAAFVVVQFKSADIQPFIYFQF